MREVEEAKAEITEMAETLPESVANGLLDCVSYMPPDALAALVDYWSDDKRTLPLAQIALEEGESNVGVMELAEYVASRERRSSRVLEQWHQSGLILDPVVWYPAKLSDERHEEVDAARRQLETLIKQRA